MRPPVHPEQLEWLVLGMALASREIQNRMVDQVPTRGLSLLPRRLADAIGSMSRKRVELALLDLGVTVGDGEVLRDACLRELIERATRKAVANDADSIALMAKLLTPDVLRERLTQMLADLEPQRVIAAKSAG